MLLKTFKYLAVIFVAYILLGHFYLYWTGDFREGNILQEGLKEELVQEDINLIPILSQPFYYLSQGNQTYALISKDGKYVLKLFKKNTLKRSPFIHIFPPIFPWKNLMIRSDKEELIKRDRIFVGYRLAYEKDRENTGLIYLSFGHVQQSLPQLTIVDNLGITRHIDLSTVPFVIQKKAKTTRQVFKEYVDRKDYNGLYEKIDELFNLYISEYEKGIVDKDHNFLDNTGFVDGKAIRLDVGKLVYDESYKNPEVYQKDLEKVKTRLRARFGESLKDN